MGRSATEKPELTSVLSVLEDSFDSTFERRFYRHRGFDDLAKEATFEDWSYGAAEVAAAEYLADGASRSLAIKIKSSGGLLLADLARHVEAAGDDDIEATRAALVDAGVADSDVVVVCRATNAQVARVATPDVLEELSSRGLKCACGRPIHEENPKDLSTVTDLGRDLLDKSRWMTVLIREELIRLGVRPDDVLVEAEIEGQEVDCLALVSGESVLLEL